MGTSGEQISANNQKSAGGLPIPIAHPGLTSSTPMTSEQYIVAYPHPSLSPLDRCCICIVGPTTRGKDLIDQLLEEYQCHSEDLRAEASLWKVGGLFVIDRCRFQPQFQTSGDLSKEDVYSHSTQKAYDWIGRRDEGARIPRGDRIVRSFPHGPHAELLDKVDIVVVTPESVSSRPNPTQSN